MFVKMRNGVWINMDYSILIQHKENENQLVTRHKLYSKMIDGTIIELSKFDTKEEADKDMDRIAELANARIKSIEYKD